MRDVRRQQQRQRREESQREALAQKVQAVLASPRPVLGRQLGAYAEEEGAARAAEPFLGPEVGG